MRRRVTHRSWAKAKSCSRNGNGCASRPSTVSRTGATRIWPSEPSVSDALANYGNAFDLAKKYTYLATKTYDYETALGLGGAYNSDPIFREIVGARTIGFVEDGEAQLGGLMGMAVWRTFWRA